MLGGSPALRRLAGTPRLGGTDTPRASFYPPRFFFFNSFNSALFFILLYFLALAPRTYLKPVVSRRYESPEKLICIQGVAQRRVGNPALAEAHPGAPEMCHLCVGERAGVLGTASGDKNYRAHLSGDVAFSGWCVNIYSG